MWNSAFGIGQFNAGMSVIVILILIWSIIWKGIALWKAARAGSKPWFIVLLVINTVGILEILYIYIFSKPRKTATTSMPAGIV